MHDYDCDTTVCSINRFVFNNEYSLRALCWLCVEKWRSCQQNCPSTPLLRVTADSREWQEMVRNVCRILITGRWRKSRGSMEETGTCDCILTLAMRLGANQFPRWLRTCLLTKPLYEREWCGHPGVARGLSPVIIICL